MNLGVKNGEAKLVPHDESWGKMAAVLIREIRAVMGADAIDAQHVGSTAVRDLPAKPILDVAVGVEDVGISEKYVDAFEARGIRYMGEVNAGQRMFYKVSPDLPDSRSHHIHVVKYGSPEWQNYLNMRDYLNASPEARRAYTEKKEELAARFAHDRALYQAGKDEIIRRLLAEAGRWREEKDARARSGSGTRYIPLEIEVSENVSRLNRILTGAGYQLYLVGGCVRDALMGRPCHDYDLLTAAPTDEVVRLLFKNEIGFDARAYAYHMAIAVFDDETLEIRSLQYENLEDDLLRRDFTMNSLAYDLNARTVIDCCGGSEDIRQKLIRNTPYFDPEREAFAALRALRFAFALGFEIEEETYAKLLGTVSCLKDASPGRISRETGKLLEACRARLVRGGDARSEQH